MDVLDLQFPGFLFPSTEDTPSQNCSSIDNKHSRKSDKRNKCSSKYESDSICKIIENLHGRSGDISIDDIWSSCLSIGFVILISKYRLTHRISCSITSTIEHSKEDNEYESKEIFKISTYGQSEKRNSREKYTQRNYPKFPISLGFFYPKHLERIGRNCQNSYEYKTASDNILNPRIFQGFIQKGNKKCCHNCIPASKEQYTARWPEKNGNKSHFLKDESVEQSVFYFCLLENLAPIEFLRDFFWFHDHIIHRSF